MLTRELITSIYEDAMDKQPPAGRDVMNADDDIQTALDAYCCAIRYETFLWANEMGYKAGSASTGELTAGGGNTKLEKATAHTISVLQRLSPQRVRLMTSYADVLLKFEMEEQEKCSGLR